MDRSLFGQDVSIDSDKDRPASKLVAPLFPGMLVPIVQLDPGDKIPDQLPGRLRLCPLYRLTEPP
jgi:hypothetical protein